MGTLGSHYRRCGSQSGRLSSFSVDAVVSLWLSRFECRRLGIAGVGVNRVSVDLSSVGDSESLFGWSKKAQVWALLNLLSRSKKALVLLAL